MQTWRYRFQKAGMIFFRCDASASMGSGHVMRCLTLANQFQNLGHASIFICQDNHDNLAGFIESRGFEVEVIKATSQKSNQAIQEEDACQTMDVLKQSNADLLVVDHYSLDHTWESKFRSYVKKILVVDDLANRLHDCDFLLDQNYYDNYEIRYNALVPQNCQKFLGPKYLLLRDEFFQCKITNNKSGFFINFGGSDYHDMTFKVVQELIKSYSDIPICVVVGSQYNGKVEELASTCKMIKVHKAVENIAELMAKSQLSIGGGGVTIFEKLLLKLPSFAYSTAENQRQALMDMGGKNYISYLGHYDQFDAKKMSKAIKSFLVNQESMSPLQIEDGKAKIVNEILEQMNHE